MSWGSNTGTELQRSFTRCRKLQLFYMIPTSLGRKAI